MSDGSWVVEVLTPAGRERFEQVRSVRLTAPDGARGLLPGHERARTAVEPGAIELRIGTDLQPWFLATEGGVAWVSPSSLVVLTRWAISARELTELQRKVEGHAEYRRGVEAAARAVARRHEVVAHRSMARLRRKVRR